MGEDRLPTGWDSERIRQALEHYESQTDEDAVQEDEAVLARAATPGEYTEERRTLFENLTLEDALDNLGASLKRPEGPP